MCFPFSLCEICQTYVLKGIDLGMKPSAPSSPLTLPPYLGLQAEQTESQGIPLRRVALVSVEIQTGIQTAHVEVQTTPV